MSVSAIALECSRRRHGLAGDPRAPDRELPGPRCKKLAALLDERSYTVLIFSSLSRLAVMDSSTELVPLIHAPPSRRRSAGNGP